jgi:hypothetical protein
VPVMPGCHQLAAGAPVVGPVCPLAICGTSSVGQPPAAAPRRRQPGRVVCRPGRDYHQLHTRLAGAHPCFPIPPSLALLHSWSSARRARPACCTHDAPSGFGCSRQHCRAGPADQAPCSLPALHLTGFL